MTGSDAKYNSLWGIPIPAFTTALSFFDGYRTETLPANLIQAQRDYFGGGPTVTEPYQEGANNTQRTLSVFGQAWRTTT